jgi:Flp pilus assembly CpaF family ATPase
MMTFAPRHAISRGIDKLAREVARLGMRQVRGSGYTAPTAGEIQDEEIVALKLKIHRRLVEEIDLRKADLTYLRDPIKLQELRTRAEAKVLALVEEEAAHIDQRDARRRLVKEVLDEALGLGPLEDLLADRSVTEIMVNRHDQIYVERNGKLQLTTAQFISVDQLRGVIERIVAPLGRRIDEKVPMADARLRDGSRVNAIIPPLSLKGPALTIRKFSKKLLGAPDLVGFGSMTSQMSSFLGAAVQARMNIVISGGTGSGKTTLLNVLASFIPEDERIITIEDAAELQLPQDHVVALESRPPNIEGEGAIAIRDLVRNALRMRPDRIVVGECRGGEALDMLQAMNTGHDGSLTTVHANTPRDALARLETMALMAGLELPSRAIRDQIASAVNLVVQQSRLQDGSRRITHVTEITGQSDGEFNVIDVFVFRQTGLGADGRITGQFVPTGHVPQFIETLGHRGIKVAREIFLHQTA